MQLQTDRDIIPSLTFIRKLALTQRITTIKMSRIPFACRDALILVAGLSISSLDSFSGMIGLEAKSEICSISHSLQLEQQIVRTLNSLQYIVILLHVY